MMMMLMMLIRLTSMMMDGGCGLSCRDSVGTEGNDRVGEGVRVERLVGEERVDWLQLGVGGD